VGVFDLGKAALPTWLALGPLDLGYPMALAGGLCAAVGHAWPVTMGFIGGRALGSLIGILAVVFPWGALIQLLAMLLGLVLRFELMTTLGLLAMPLLSFAFGRPPAVTVGCIAMIALTAVKRVEGNRRPLPRGPDRWTVVWRRLWLDRDVRDHQEWLARGPGDRLRRR
jgi:glycerol-3-phosphate acyltransferase PlsY